MENEIISLNELYLLMISGEVDFIYEKKDGTKRTAKGTLDAKIIPEEVLPEYNNDTTNPKSTNFKYFDLDKSAWRSLSYDSSTVELIKS